MKIKSYWLVGAVIAPLIVLGLLVAACGNGDDEETTPPTEVEENGHAEGTVHLETDEWSILGEGGGAIEPVAAGEVTFEVHNIGEVPHEVVIIKTDTDPAELPVVESLVDEEAAGEVIGEIEEFPAGAIEVGSFDLEPGNYALICNIAGHYEQGMYARLVVE